MTIMTFQEKRVSTCSVCVFHHWITHTSKMFLTVVTYVVKFLIVSGMAQRSRHWGHCRCSLQFVGVNVSVGQGTSGISLTR